MAEDRGLSDQERAELEELRAERAAREQAARAAAERAELEELRRQRAASEAETEAERRDAAARERGRRLMQPDEDDLKMPVGQKVVILVIAGVAVLWLLATLFG